MSIKGKGIYEKIKGLYNSLMDEESKLIFEHRLLYSLSGNLRHIAEMTYSLFIKKHGKDNNLTRLIENENVKSKKAIIFGAGLRGLEQFEFISHIGVMVDCFCDNDRKKWGTVYCGVPVISPDDLVRDKKDPFVVVAIQNYVDEVTRQLINMGISPDKIINGCPDLGCQYFDNSIIKLGNEDVFVDAGCYDGASSVDFVKLCGGNYSKIYAFEPDHDNFLKCKNTFIENKMNNFTLFETGLWSADDTLNFTSTSAGDSRINAEGTAIIQGVSLDKVLKGEKATFIKMDIEGSELEALKGAQNTIRMYKPMLAVCVYHKPEDILELPLYIKELVPEYRLYFRHYSMSHCETVLYAVN